MAYYCAKFYILETVVVYIIAVIDALTVDNRDPAYI